MRLNSMRAMFAGLAICGVLTAAADAQLPLTARRDSGQTVTPAFEGWYRNPDGTFTLSFGYYNRNIREELTIPIGSDNLVAPGPPNQNQPTRFGVARHWGVFTVIVPADFGVARRVTWTLRVRGQVFSVPGSLNPRWEIDALAGQATGNTPPVVRLTDTGESGQGPRGVRIGPIPATVGRPLALAAIVTDDAKGWAAGDGSLQSAEPVFVSWWVHQGDGAVAFAPQNVTLTEAGGRAGTVVTFSEPGEYVIRVRVNDSPVTVAGHVQCCWTNGYYHVRVTR